MIIFELKIMNSYDRIILTLILVLSLNFEFISRFWNKCCNFKRFNSRLEFADLKKDFVEFENVEMSENEQNVLDDMGFDVVLFFFSSFPVLLEFLYIDFLEYTN